MIRAKAYENRFILDSVPDYYERLKQSYDLRFFQQEVLGEYLNAAGDRAYSAFEFLEHVKPQKVDPQLPIYWALDFNVDPLCSVVVQVDRDLIRVIDEIVLNRATTQDACDEFSRRYGSHTAGYSIYGDASGNAQSTRGASDYEIVKAHFRTRREQARYEVPKGNPSVRNRVATLERKAEGGGRGDSDGNRSQVQGVGEGLRAGLLRGWERGRFGQEEGPASDSCVRRAWLFGSL